MPIISIVKPREITKILAKMDIFLLVFYDHTHFIVKLICDR